jgi:hypothetical protein
MLMLGFISNVPNLLGTKSLCYCFSYVFFLLNIAALLWHVWLWWNYCLNASWKVCICHVM